MNEHYVVTKGLQTIEGDLRKAIGLRQNTKKWCIDNNTANLQQRRKQRTKASRMRERQELMENANPCNTNFGNSTATSGVPRILILGV